MTLSLADESTHYIYSFDVHDHIVCIQQCLKETHDVIYYYALFKSTELLCTCKRDFDWRQIPSGSDVTVQRFEIREDIYECGPVPCIHGTCNDLIGQYVCDCDWPWVGTNCDEDFDDCAVAPCVHGSCTDYVEAYTCTCETGYDGTNCDTDINECSPDPCVHGTCNDLIGHYTCTCSSPWVGAICDRDFDECSLSPCQHGSCTDHVNAYTCACPLPWIGTNCETEICKNVLNGQYQSQGYVVTWGPIYGMDSCWIYCLNDDRCQSCHMQDGSSNCILNALTSVTSPAGIVTDSTFTLYERC